MISNSNDESRPSTRMAHDRQQSMISYEEWNARGGAVARQMNRSGSGDGEESFMSVPYSMADTETGSIYRQGDPRASSLFEHPRDR
jgi:stress response protein SCP2